MDGLGGMFRTEVREDGKKAVVMRPRTCLCGEKYEQRQLSERFMTLCENQGQGAVDAVMKDIPDLWVPVHCPKCERRQLQPTASYALPVNRVRLADERRFSENMARLFGAWNRPHDDATVRAYWKALEHALSDEQFERGVILAVRVEKRWPAAATIVDLVRAA